MRISSIACGCLDAAAGHGDLVDGEPLRRGNGVPNFGLSQETNPWGETKTVLLHPSRGHRHAALHPAASGGPYAPAEIAV
jgi:hypothetical protein